MRYSVQHRDQIFVNSYRFSSFAKNMDKIIGKNISKTLGGKCSQNLDHTKKPATDVLKTSSIGVIQKTVEATGDLIGNKIANRTTKVSRSSPQNNSEIIMNEHGKEIPNGRHISPEERQKIIDDLRFI